jgi:hypothetical protein
VRNGRRRVGERARRTGVRDGSIAGMEACVALEDAYIAAWTEWEDSGDAELWAATDADGLAL